MLALGIAISVAVLDSSIANIALPTIAGDLHVSPASSVWVVNAYQIAVTISLLPFSALGDIYGYRRVYTLGLAVFTAASLVCALSGSLPILILGRLIQGLGGAGLMSVNAAIVRTIYPRALLGRGLGLNSLIVATSSAIGPSVAAAILSVAHWPWLFAVNVPLGLLALAMTRSLPRSERSGHRFDLASALLSALTFGLFVWSLDGLGHGQAGAVSAGALLIAGLCGAIFVRRQLALAHPMLPMDLFRNPVFSLSVATSICSFCAQTIAYVALPFLFEAGGMSPIGTGILMTPWPATVAIVAPISGRLSDRLSAGLMGGVGLTIMAIGLLLIAFMPAHAPWWSVMGRMALTGGGFALFQSPNNRLLLGSVPRERSGAGSGMLSTARQLGQSTGAALAAVSFGLTEAGGVRQGALVAVLAGAGFAGLAAVVSSLRLLRVQGEGA
ncbi:MAG: MFS transporter [Rhodospirillales bacterium]|nr:MFS transporter [Rhodospirillales bacterium]MDE2199175.1 MFS transporter [Rhodospirillales bacterium]MDE2574533.1 MFS transporter [Rhodospirillales bacterium]